MAASTRFGGGTSVEDPHNAVHVAVGYPMTSVKYVIVSLLLSVCLTQLTLLLLQVRGVPPDLLAAPLPGKNHLFLLLSVCPQLTTYPIFWLHHCQVDRLYEKYLQLEPDSQAEFMAQQRSLAQHLTGRAAAAGGTTGSKKAVTPEPDRYSSWLEPFNHPRTGEAFMPEHTFDTEGIGYIVIVMIVSLFFSLFALNYTLFSSMFALD